MTQRVTTGSQRWQDLGRDPWNQDAGDLDGGLDGALSDSGGGGDGEEAGCTYESLKERMTMRTEI